MSEWRHDLSAFRQPEKFNCNPPPQIHLKPDRVCQNSSGQEYENVHPEELCIHPYFGVTYFNAF